MAHNLEPAMSGIRQAIESSVADIKNDPRITELQKLLMSLNALEDITGQPRTLLGAIFRFEGGIEVGSGLSIKPDEFYGLEPLEASKKYLKKIGRSVSVSEIANGIRSGGCDPGSEDKLAVSLARSTMEIAKIGDDLFGLVEFYPHINRSRSPRKKKNGSSPSLDSNAGSAPEEEEDSEQDSAQKAGSPDIVGATSGDPKRKGEDA